MDIDHRILRQHVSDLREKSGGGNLEVLSDHGLFGDIQKMVRRNMQTMTDAGCGAQEMDVLEVISAQKEDLAKTP